MRIKVLGCLLVAGAILFICLTRQPSVAREKSLVYETASAATNNPPATSTLLNSSKSTMFQSGPGYSADGEAPPMSVPALSVDDPLVPTLSSGPASKNMIALTFDDGPHPTITPKILDELRKRKIHATFFVLGSRIKMYPWIAQQIIAEGHELGNHTYDHRSLPTLTNEQAEKEIMETQAEIRRITGYETSLFRPPYGALRSDIKLLLRDKNFKVILWSVDPQDWKVRNSEKILTYVVENTRKGSIILCHDINKSTLEALPQMLDQLLEQGYEFATVNRLCDLPGLKLVSSSNGK